MVYTQNLGFADVNQHTVHNYFENHAIKNTNCMFGCLVHSEGATASASLSVNISICACCISQYCCIYTLIRIHHTHTLVLCLNVLPVVLCSVLFILLAQLVLTRYLFLLSSQRSDIRSCRTSPTYSGTKAETQRSDAPR